MVFMTMVSKPQFKARALGNFGEVERTGPPLVVTDHGKPVIKVVPYVEDWESAD